MSVGISNRQPPARVPGAEARPGLTLAVLCCGGVLSVLDQFIVNVALPQIARDFHGAGLDDLSWVLNGYAIVFAALLIPAGRLADLTSRKGGFLVGTAVFTLASALCAAATGVGPLVAFRVLQAGGAALLVPTSLSLVLATRSPERRAGAVRLWSAVSGLSAAFGPVLGGLLVLASWRWVFLVTVPVGLAALVAGWRLLPDPRGVRGPLPDAAGAATLAAGVAALVLALVRGGAWGRASWQVLGLLAASVVLLAAFFARSARHPSPVLDLGLLRTRSYSVALLGTLLFSSAFGALLLSMVVWPEDGWRWSALQTGLAIAPGPLLVLPASLVAGRFIPRLGAGPVIAAGCVLFAAGGLWAAAAIGLRPSFVTSMLIPMLLTGAGTGLAMPTLLSTAAGSLPAQHYAAGSAAASMLRQIGLAVGVAALVAVLGPPAAAAGRLAGFERGWFLVAVLCVAAALLALLLRAGRPALAAARDA